MLNSNLGNVYFKFVFFQVELIFLIRLSCLTQHNIIKQYKDIINITLVGIDLHRLMTDYYRHSKSVFTSFYTFKTRPSKHRITKLLILTSQTSLSPTSSQNLTCDY